MLSYQQLDLPDSWKPIFREIDHWDFVPAAECPALEEWMARKSLAFRHKSLDTQGFYLSFLVEPIWCGNVPQKAGVTVLGVSTELPDATGSNFLKELPLLGGWPEEIAGFFQEFFSQNGQLLLPRRMQASE